MSKVVTARAKKKFVKEIERAGYYIMEEGDICLIMYTACSYVFVEFRNVRNGDKVLQDYFLSVN